MPEDSMHSMYTTTMFPVNSRIRLPCGTVYDKLGDSQWHRYQGGAVPYNGFLPSEHDFPHGSEVSYKGQRCFIKDGHNWWPVAWATAGVPPTSNSLAFATLGREASNEDGQLLVDSSNNWWSTGLQFELGTASTLTHITVPRSDRDTASEVSSRIQILEQVEYRHGPQPIHDRLVNFLVDMSSAARGAVPDADRPAYEYDLVEKEKVAIRFGFTHINSCSYRTKQRTIARSREKTGITRGRLAMLVAQEVKELVDALARNNTSLKAADGRALTFEELVLVDVRRRSTASVQPTIGVRTT
ncbi:hypothetical protein V8D89_009974 [Ganoderma adspersum]